MAGKERTSADKAPVAWIGWDVGGAHLKAAAVDAQGRVTAALQLPCPLWRGLDHLERALDQALVALGRPTAAARCGHAATMTGEMVDLFDDRASGVRAIVQVLRQRLHGARLVLYAGARGFIDAQQAGQYAAELASANWRATSEFVAGQRRDALLLDIGSTTADAVPVRDGRVAARGSNDFERLAASELVYCGIARTPLMALADAVLFEGRQVPLMAEHFATTADVYRLTGELDEGSDQHAAADGGAKTRAASARRIARMIGRDVQGTDLAPWAGLAREFRDAQLARIAGAAARVIQDSGVPPGAPIVAAGSGAFLARELARRLQRSCIPIADLFDAPRVDRTMLAACAPAAAVAVLARKPAAANAAARPTQAPPTLVVKLGGSLYGDISLLHWLQAMSQAGPVRYVVVPGGGPFADRVRQEQRRLGFDDDTAHRMALMAMDQFGRMLCALHPAAVACADTAGFEAAWRDARLPVWLPSSTLAASDELARDWSVTSDTIAAWLTRRIGARAMLLVKSCDLPRLPPGHAADPAARNRVADLDVNALAAAGAIDPDLSHFINANRLHLEALRKDQWNLLADVTRLLLCRD
jgi:probable H4MPT-linked C1 transfer pathway protein